MSNQHEPCFRIYLGKSNWVNLSPQVTEDLKAIYEEGKPTRYKLAPGLVIDILPRDVDCNSKTTELPRLMRADLCYDDDDDGNIMTQIKSNTENQAAATSPTLTERQEVVQQNLSQFIKAELEKQGIVDAFPPADAGQDLLPHVSALPPHRHLGLVPAPHKSTKRTLQRQKQPLNTEKQLTSSAQPSSSSPLLNASGRPTTKRKQPAKKIINDDRNFTPSSTSSSSGDSTSSNNTQVKLAGSRVQHPPPYHLRSSASSSTTEKKAKLEKSPTFSSTKSISSPVASNTYFSQTELPPYHPKLAFDYEEEDDDDKTTAANGSEHTEFFPGMDFVTPTMQLSPLWYTNFQQHQQQEQPQRVHPMTLSSPPLPILHHHHHHHHQVQLQSRDHHRLQQFPEDDEDDPAGWDLHQWTSRHHYHHHQQQQHQDFNMYPASMYSVPPQTIHRYAADSAAKVDLQPSTFPTDTNDRDANPSLLPAPSSSGMHHQLQHSPHQNQPHSHPLTAHSSENQYTNFSFMPSAALTNVEDTPGTAFLPASYPSTPSSPPQFPGQSTDTTL